VIREVVRYTGRVQGVGFRATAAATASGFAVTGWVRNERDGSVMLEAQGTAWDVERFLEAIGERLARFIRGADRHGALVVSGERGFVVRKE
jgi:acylphosphatase